ncbi:hypothetical protein [Neisseria iguanae]|uniref:Uncharacterized protein n=1 Tax=Neisseria iguanae TaxID=90242 RepID=A0A2P7TZD6_9NEIS|nr:hypothetical protein [Neisseria iguanae]PSJ80096.1 hypothetical protein C7N83_08240 [Neisseria iguanae]
MEKLIPFIDAAWLSVRQSNLVGKWHCTLDGTFDEAGFKMVADAEFRTENTKQFFPILFRY